MKKTTGFTLIELLVVIGIIAVLTTFLVANFVGVKQRARDAQRKSDLRNIQAALEIYRSDQGTYPSAGEFPSSCGAQFNKGTSIYMQSVPCDPLNAGLNVYTYTKNVDGSYSLVACLENGNDSQVDKDGGGIRINCGGSETLWQYTLKNP